MNKLSITIVGIASIILIGAALYTTRDSRSEPRALPNDNDTVSNEVDSTIRARVTEFGTQLKNVSLLQPPAQLKAELKSEYGTYITPELLTSWQANASLALGRSTSSPWPDRIEVVEVSKISESEYRVEGNVIELTSADRPMEPAAIYPVTLTFEYRNSAWLISEVVKGAYSEIPQRVSVVGTWTCLPHRDTTGPQTMECAFGIKLADGSGNLAVNTSLMSTYPVDFSTGTKVRIDGVLVPVEHLSSDRWQKYDMKGIISATSIVRVE